MSAINGTGERLRRATQLWHAYLATTGQRFELAQFLSDAALQKQVVDAALANGDAKLAALARDWLRDTSPASTPAAPVARASAPAPSPATPGEPPKKQRYLKGVR